MANYFDVQLDVLVGGSTSTDEINLIEEALRKPPVCRDSEVADSGTTPSYMTAREFDILMGEPADVTKPPAECADAHPCSFQRGRDLGNQARRFHHRFKVRDTNTVIDRILQVSQQFPSAVFLFEFFDPLSASGKLVIYEGKIVREMCDGNRKSHTQEWVLPDIFAPYRTEYINDWKRGLLWNQWVTELAAAVEYLQTGVISPDSDDVESLHVEDVPESDDLTRAYPEKGTVMRFAILPKSLAGEPKTAKSHLIAGKGIYRCLEENDIAYCCGQLGDKGITHIVIPILRYISADPASGEVDQAIAPEWKLAYIDVNRASYREVGSLLSEQDTEYGIDLIMSHSADGSGYQFRAISTKPAWTLDPRVKAAVEKAAESMFLLDGGERLAGKLGTTVTWTEWDSALSSVSEATEESSSADTSLSNIDYLD